MIIFSFFAPYFLSILYYADAIASPLFSFRFRCHYFSFMPFAFAYVMFFSYDAMPLLMYFTC